MTPLLDRLLDDLSREAVQSSQTGRGPRMQIKERTAASAVLDIQCPREDSD